jgi:hypothetical protein
LVPAKNLKPHHRGHRVQANRGTQRKIRFLF